MSDVGGADSVVAEIQGLDGAFSFAELLLQRIWARLEFDRASLVTTDGRPIKIFSPGAWNRRGGPDFLAARLEIQGVRSDGDVEVHLRVRDWQAHGHAFDPNYRQVVLHVVLFPTEQFSTRGWDDQGIPILVLLPLMQRSLEEYAADDAIERLAQHPLTAARALLEALSPEERAIEIQRGAEARWTQKRMFAALRLDQLGWRNACHHTALEILGYRFNRVPMLTLASQFPIEEWVAPAEKADGRVETLFAIQSGRWHRQAIRPANAPCTRLRQYIRWSTLVPDWPERLMTIAEAIPKLHAKPGEGTTAFRKRVDSRALMKRIANEVCAEAVGGTRFHTLVCDGFCPLLAAKIPEKHQSLSTFWFHAYVGDLPENVRGLGAAMTQLDGRRNPLSHGVGQGLLHWILRQQEALAQPEECAPGGAGLDKFSTRKLL